MKLTLFLAFLFTLSVGQLSAQESLKDIRKKGWQSFIYRIPADTAEKYIAKSAVFPDHYLQATPFQTVSADADYLPDLPAGNYLVISAIDNELVTQYYCSSNLQVQTLNNQRNVTLEIKNKNGGYINNASAWVNKKGIAYNEVVNGFVLKAKRLDEALLKIAVPGDTLFLLLASKEDQRHSSLQQRLSNFRYSKTGRVVTWPARSVKTMITRPARYWLPKKRKRSLPNKGYMVFNKPKYLPQDTVKFKAYILNRKWNRYKNRADVFLEYYENGRVSKKLIVLKPVSPGAFVYEFPLSDSLQSDKSYSMVFKDKKKKILFSDNFKVEDYVLDEVASYSLRSEKKNYFRGDTMVFYTNAKDVNGLAVMDGRVSVTVLSGVINKFYSERLFIADTLWKEEKILAVQGDTKFEVPLTNFPDANLNLSVLAVFKNSNNEIQEKELEIDFDARSKLIQVQQASNMIKAEYIENGKSVPKDAWLEKSFEEKSRPVRLPYESKIDTHADGYEFLIKNDTGKILLRNNFEINDGYKISYSRIQERDTTGFSLYNPYNIPVYYTVFFGNKIIAAGSDSTELITWKKILPHNKAYDVRWRYMWGGKEQGDYNSMGVLEKILETNITGAQTIYPGQTDTITVSVKDYKGRNADNVNLTAVSYNSQFQNEINVKEPPYLQKFRSRKKILRNGYETEDANFTKKFLLGGHQQWINKFALDTMKYYNFLFPKTGIYNAASGIAEFTPQLAVHAVDKGVPQEIYMLYINRQFAYYNGVTDKSKYAFPVVPGYTQIAFRLKDKYIEIDSIYLQPFYKHDISFDINNLPSKAKIKKATDYYTWEEVSLIEKSIWQLQNDYRTNNGYVWQGEKLVYLGSEKTHTAGPFIPNDSLQFFKPGDFDFKFPFESGYEYKLTPKMARLEKSSVFRFTAPKKYLPVISGTKFILGDTLIAPPVISYSGPIARPLLRANDLNAAYNNHFEKGKLKIEIPADSSIIYTILYSENESTVFRIKGYDFSNFYALVPGIYSVVLVTNNYSYLHISNIEIKKDGTYCVRAAGGKYTADNRFIHFLQRHYERLNDEEVNKRRKAWDDTRKINTEVEKPLLLMPVGGGSIIGKVVDANGKNPIPGASVSVKGYKRGTSTGADGNFILSNLKSGSYAVVIASVGYMQKEILVKVSDDNAAIVNVSLKMNAANLNEVVVIGYGTRKKMSVTGSVSVVRSDELGVMLQGKIPGVNVSNSDNRLGLATNIRIRGVASLRSNSAALTIVDGVIIDPDDFAKIKPEDIAEMSMLKDEAAVAMYGSAAANGVILITTKGFSPKALREKFSDYAFWKPNLFTDKNGEVKFTVTYPDNITGWQTYIVGMDKKRRLTKAGTFVKSFKPLLGQLSAPQFLIEGDSSNFIGKTINYTSAGYSVKSDFSINGKIQSTVSRDIVPNASVIDDLAVKAEGIDSLSVQYMLTSSSGYSDGELRKIPVFKKGIEETVGNFWVLENDTTISFVPDKNAGNITVYAQNNTLDLLLDEISYLKKYPYYCMEQTASKLTGLLMEQKVRKVLSQKFAGEKEIDQLTAKLQKSQLFDGGWSWWPGGNANLSITNYVTRSLLLLRSNALIETNIRNAMLYLQNRLGNMLRQDLLASLVTMSEANHLMDYDFYLKKIPFDSLTIHNQWQYVKIKQHQKLGYERELEKLMAKKTETMLGGLYWGEDSYYWNNNAMATTVLAFKVLLNDEKYKPATRNIIQYFLEKRKQGHWMNTVESAGVLSAILPELLKDNTDFTAPASIKINNEPVVNKFPVTVHITNLPERITLTKSGGGMVYLTAYQQLFNAAPEPVTDKFIIESSFTKSGNNIAELTAGEKVKMKVQVSVLKDADYVQIEIPIPAGCTYGDKKQDGSTIHKEFLKNKAVFFLEKLTKGKYEYEIELEPRYTGKYHLNPAKAELMYFPTFYGRNEMKQIVIKK